MPITPIFRVDQTEGYVRRQYLDSQYEEPAPVLKPPHPPPPPLFRILILLTRVTSANCRFSPDVRREVIVAIEAPHVRSPEVDFYVQGDDFKFSVHP